MNGLILFCKYAFAPNILSYCGPKNNKIFIDIFNDYLIKGNLSDESLKELRDECINFKAAVPYLELIAGSSNIKDFFDERVVEAYWLGNALLENVNRSRVYNDIEERFKKNMSLKKWALLNNSDIFKKARPFHAFHVLNIFSKVDPMFLKGNEEALGAINNCVISFGKIKNIVSDEKNKKFLTVFAEYSPLEFGELGNLKFGNKITRSFYSMDKLFNTGDNVSLHWGYVCDKISQYQKINLEYWTNYYLKLFNCNQI